MGVAPKTRTSPGSPRAGRGFSGSFVAGACLAFGLTPPESLEVRIDGSVTFEFPEVVGTHEPDDVSPQLDRVGSRGHPTDHRPEDPRPLPTVETDRRHPERPDLLDHGAMPGDDLVPRFGVGQSHVVQRWVQTRVGKR